MATGRLGVRRLRGLTGPEAPHLWLDKRLEADEALEVDLEVLVGRGAEVAHRDERVANVLGRGAHLLVQSARVLALRLLRLQQRAQLLQLRQHDRRVGVGGRGGRLGFGLRLVRVRVRAWVRVRVWVRVRLRVRVQVRVERMFVFGTCSAEWMFSSNPYLGEHLLVFGEHCS